MKNEDTTSSKRNQKKQDAIKKLAKSKEQLLISAADMWKSIKKIALYKNQEIAEQLLAKIKEEIKNAERK